jgi:hypothetical protein
MNKARRLVVCWLSLVIIFAAANESPAQGLLAIPGAQSLDLTGVRIIPKIQIGYQKLGLNFNLPASTLIPPAAPFPSSLDLKFQDADLWVGTVALAIDCPSRLSAEIKGQANAKRRINVFEREEWVFGGQQGVTWTGSQLEWWAIEGRVMYRLRADCSLVAGLRRDHLAVNLGDPRDASGNPLNFGDSGVLFRGVTFARNQSYYSDLISKLWIPYVGLELVGPGYRALLIGSPFASAEIKVPAAVLFDLALRVQLSPFFPPATTEFLSSDSLLYRVNKPALFLEGSFQYDLNLSPSMTLGLWCSGSWMSLRGQGNWNHDSWAQVIANGVPLPPNFDSQSQDNTATYTRYFLGWGLSGVWSF